MSEKKTEQHKPCSCPEGSCFLCPHCYSYLNVGNQLIFKVKTKDNSQGLIVLKNAPGNFESTASHGIEKVEGELYTFLCPVCHASLHDKKLNENLVHILLIDKDNTMNDIFFSGIFGEQCSFVIKKGEIQFYGKHYHEYMNLFEQYKNYYESRL